MKQQLSLAATSLLLLGGLVLSQLQRVDAPVNPAALLYFIADTQRELTRIPMVYTRIPDQNEIEAGKSIADYYASRLAAPGDPEASAIQNYVREVGARLAAKAGRKLPYRFDYVASSDFVNAFALPGGRVFLGAGLVALMETEDELAAVLAHEIEHIDHYHCAERLQWELALRKIPLGRVLEIPAAVFQAGYTKEQEFEADREGTHLAVAAGYSPAGAVRVFEQFEKLHRRVAERPRTPQEEVSRVAVEILRGYFASHPPPADRIEQLERAFAKELAASPPTQPLQFAYVYIRERAARQLGLAQQLKPSDKPAQAAYREAAELASRSLELMAGAPALPALLVTAGRVPALRILAMAQLGLSEPAAATLTYRKLVELDPGGADTVRSFADDLAARALAAEQFQQAAGLAEFSLELQPNQPGAMKMFALARLGLGEFSTAEEVGLNLDRLYPDAGSELATTLHETARRAMRGGEYSTAVRLLNLSLKLESTDSARRALADAQFAHGEFSAAAETYRLLLRERSPNLEEVRRWADALGASGGPAQAAGEFRAWAERTRNDDVASAAQLSIEVAGLQVLSGDDTLARTLTTQATGPQPIAIAPEHLARLGWWYTKAGRAEEAADFLRTASQMRPGDRGLQNSLGWAEWEAGQLDQAVRRVEFALPASASSSPLGNTPQMGRALVNWSKGQSDAALDEFDGVSKQFPTWLNFAWVRAVYPARVAEAVGEFHTARAAQAEFDRANFPLARALISSLVEKHPNDRGLLRRYADVLSALGPKEALAEFQAFLDRAHLIAEDATQQVRLDLAGLKLLARDSADAGAIARALLSGNRRGFEPEMLARLAWWYLRTGSTPVHVETLLGAGARQHPDHPVVANGLAWLELERGNLPRAEEGFSRISSGAHRFPPGSTPQIGHAITLWRRYPTARAPALSVFSSVVKDSPQWLNPNWVKALCPNHVVQVVTELRTAHQKQLQSQPTARDRG